MYMLQQERPQGVHFRKDEDMFSAEDLPICLHCKHSEVNVSYPKDEMNFRRLCNLQTIIYKRGI